MDQDGFKLTAGRLTDRLLRIEQSLPVRDPRRGASLFDLVRQLVSGLAASRDLVAADFNVATRQSEQTVLGRKLLRLTQQSEILALLTPFIDDVDQQDVPLGLLQIIDVLIESLLPDGADPIVHLDARYMYSTLDLVKVVQPTLVALGISPSASLRPVVFFLPAGDPSNALLMPILAHEVAHAAVERSNLGSEILRRVDASKLNALFASCLARAPKADPGRWQVDLFHWLDELICDAIATVLCGPSMLFASAAFLPASDPGTLGSHPFPADRVQLCIEQLVALGWGEVMKRTCPQTLAWLQRLSTPPSSGDPHEDFLRGSIEIVKQPTFEVARGSAGSPLDPATFDALSRPLCELMNDGIPPAQVDGAAPDAWAITLAAWIHEFDRLGDSPETLASAVADTTFNDFVQKSIEMARILHLWRTS
jgi:hypothetical protein